MFDSITSEKLGFYVYALIDPEDKEIFYIGKGKGNRVFDHKAEVIKNPDSLGSIKKNKIKSILSQGNDVEHVIIRHGLTEKDSFLIEATLIDFLNHFGNALSNEVSGYASSFYGIKTTDELIRQYNAPPLKALQHKVVIININKRYASAKISGQSIYEATKQAWVISEQRLSSLEYALAEYEGIIIGVYKIKEWYRVKTDNNKRNNRWGFNGAEAELEIQELYKNKSIAHIKKPGAANPIRFTI
jgi:uncharacterized protein